MKEPSLPLPFQYKVMTVTPFSKFILVDDDLINNMISRFCIQKIYTQVQIHSFTYADKALEFIQNEYNKPGINSPTCLFLDINMPNMSGWDLLEEFKSLDKHVQSQFSIYILSWSIDEYDEIKAEANAFVTGFISKPLTGDSIQKLIVPVGKD